MPDIRLTTRSLRGYVYDATYSELAVRLRLPPVTLDRGLGLFRELRLLDG